MPWCLLLFQERTFIAVAIAVAGLPVSVFLVLYVHAVEDEGHVLVFVRSIETLDIREDFLVHVAGPHDEDSHVHKFCDDAGICHDVDRRTIQEDVVILVTHLLDHVPEPFGKQELCRVRRKVSDREKVEVRSQLVHIRSEVIDFAVQIGSYSCMDHIQRLAQRSLAKVQIDHDDLRSLEGHAGGKVHH